MMCNHLDYKLFRFRRYDPETFIIRHFTLIARLFAEKIFSVNQKQLVLCLDFGGTKLAAGIVDVQAMQILDVKQTFTRAEKGAETNYSDMIALAETLDCIDQIEAVGVTYGGYAREDKVLLSLHVPGWEDFPLKERLQAHYGVQRVHVVNDANAVALGELRFGAGRGCHSMLFVTVSTGIGGGIILNGKLHEGAEGISGEIGHVVVEPGGRLCDCGGRGCLEAMASGPAIATQTREYLDAHPEALTRLRDVPTLTAQIIAQMAEEGDPVAVAQMQKAARYLGIAIGNAVNLLDVQRVVVGGGVSRSGSVWWDEVRAMVKSIVLPWHSPVDVLPSALGTQEGIWGAAALLVNE